MKLLGAYNITCTGVTKRNNDGSVAELSATYDPESITVKKKGNLGWLSLEHATPVEARIYSRLFTKPIPGKSADAVAEGDGDVSDEC